MKNTKTKAKANTNMKENQKCFTVVNSNNNNGAENSTVFDSKYEKEKNEKKNFG